MKWVDVEDAHKTFDPQFIFPLIQEDLKPFCFLVILDDMRHDSFEMTFEPFLQGYTQAFTQDSEVSLLIYLTERPDLPKLMDWVEDKLENRTNQPDITMIGEHLQLDNMANLIASCHAYIELCDPTKRPEQALLLDKRVIVKDTDTVPSYIAECKAVTMVDAISAEDWKVALTSQLIKDPPSPRVEILSNLLTREECVAHMLKTRVVAIFAWGPSGSALVQTLFDSHPQILMFPMTAMAKFNTYCWPILGAVLEHCPTMSPDPLLELFIQQIYPHVFDATHHPTEDQLNQLGENRDQAIQVDKQAFLKHAKALLLLLRNQGHALTRRNFFIVVHYAYAMAQGQSLIDKQVIVYPLHDPTNAEDIELALQDFPEMKAIVTCRHPLKSFHSNLRLGLRNGLLSEQPDGTKPSYEDLVNTGNYHMLYRFQLIGDRNIIHRFADMTYLKIEELHEKPHELMGQLAQWLNISWDDRLLQSTCNGLTYWGNRYMNQPLSQFSKTYHQQDQSWKRLAGWVETMAMSGLMAEYMQKHDYGSISPWHKTLLPLLIFLPSQIEWRACWKALRNKDQANFHTCILLMLQRYWWSYEYLLGRPIYVRYQIVPTK